MAQGSLRPPPPAAAESDSKKHCFDRCSSIIVLCFEDIFGPHRSTSRSGPRPARPQNYSHSHTILGFGPTPPGRTNSLVQSKVLREYKICGSVKRGPRACEHWAAENAPRSPLPRPQFFPNRAPFFSQTGNQKPSHIPVPFLGPTVLFPKENYTPVPKSGPYRGPVSGLQTGAKMRAPGAEHFVDAPPRPRLARG